MLFVKDLRDRCHYRRLASPQVGYASIDDMIYDAVPNSIRHDSALNLPPPLTETEALKTLRDISKMNKVSCQNLDLG